jgi:hypothetical protein
MVDGEICLGLKSDLSQVCQADVDMFVAFDLGKNEQGIQTKKRLAVSPGLQKEQNRRNHKKRETRACVKHGFDLEVRAVMGIEPSERWDEQSKSAGKLANQPT